MEATIAAAAVRARPIALTALAAMLGGFFILDDPIFGGLAVSLIFGLLVALFRSVKDSAIVVSGVPLALTGGAKARLDAMIPEGHVGRIHLTLTDDHPWAQAFVIIEAIKEG